MGTWGSKKYRGWWKDQQSLDNMGIESREILLAKCGKQNFRSQLRGFPGKKFNLEPETSITISAQVRVTHQIFIDH